MNRCLKLVLAWGLVFGLTASLAVAEEEGAGALRPRRKGFRGRMEKAMRMRRNLRFLMMPLMGAPKVREEMKRYLKEVKPIAEAVKALHEKIRDAIEDGAKPKELLDKYLPEAEELAKKLLAAYATHAENLANLAKDADDKGIEALARRLLRPGRPGRPRFMGRRKGLPKKRPPHDEGPPKPENPFED